MRPEIEEYRHRLRKVTKSMERDGLDVMIVTSPENMNYLTGYDGWTFYVPQAILIVPGETPIWIGRKMDRTCALETCWLNSDDILTYGEDLVQSADGLEYREIVHQITRRDPKARRIGVEMGNYYVSHCAVQSMQRAAPNHQLIDCTGLVNWVRIEKSDFEIDRLREAASVAKGAIQCAYDVIEPGQLESLAAADIIKSQIRAKDGFVGDYCSVPILLGAGDRARAPHLLPSNQPFEKGTMVNIELGGASSRYHAGLSRSMYLGRPETQVEDFSKAVVEGLNLLLQAGRPGLTCHELHAVWDKHITSCGFHKSSRIGYSIGLSYPPDWGEHTASLRRDDTTVMKPGMTFHIILGMWEGSTNFSVSETCLVTGNGLEALSDLNRDLFVKA